MCDNVDLDTVLMEYESFYFIKFQKYPKLTKKLPEQGKCEYNILKALSGWLLKQRKLLEVLICAYTFNSELLAPLMTMMMKIACKRNNTYSKWYFELKQRVMLYSFI